MGIETILLSLNHNLKFPSKSRVGNVVIHRIPFFKINFFSKIFSLFFILPTYLFKVFSSDVVLIYSNNTVLYEVLIFICRSLRKKVIFRSTMYGDDDMKSLIGKISFLKKARVKNLGKINGYFSLSPLFSRNFREVFQNDTLIFESNQGVDTSKFRSVSLEVKKDLKKKLGLPLDVTIIISAGYLIKRKGFDDIFNVLRKIDLPFLYLVVGNYELGKGHYLSDLIAEMLSLYEKGKEILGDKVLFTGPVKNIEEFMQVSDIFLLNSQKEGLPNVMLEAMACGACTVSVDLPGLKDFVLFDHDNSLIYSNVNEMRDMIEIAITNTSLREEISSGAVKFINENCKIEKIGEEFISRFF